MSGVWVVRTVAPTVIYLSYRIYTPYCTSGPCQLVHPSLPSRARRVVTFFAYREERKRKRAVSIDSALHSARACHGRTRKQKSRERRSFSVGLVFYVVQLLREVLLLQLLLPKLLPLPVALLLLLAVVVVV